MEDTRDTEALGIQRPQVAQVLVVAAPWHLRCRPSQTSVWSDTGENVGWGWWARRLGKKEAKIGWKFLFKILNWRDINTYLTLRRKQQYYYALFKSLLHLGQIQGVEPTEPLIPSLYLMGWSFENTAPITSFTSQDSHLLLEKDHPSQPGIQALVHMDPAYSIKLVFYHPYHSHSRATIDHSPFQGQCISYLHTLPHAVPSS